MLIKILFEAAVKLQKLFSVLLCIFGVYKFIQRILYKNFTKQTFLLGGMLSHSICWVLLYAFVHLEIRYVLTSVVMFLILGCAPRAVTSATRASEI